MNAAQFCAEYGKELRSGRISFDKRVVDKFIKIYTYLDPEDFTKQQRKNFISLVMIDLYNKGFSKYAVENYTDQPVEKIEIPTQVF